MKFFLFLVVFVSSLFSDNPQLSPQEKNWLDKKHQVTIRVASWAPFQIVDRNGNFSGISVDIAKKILDKYKIDYKFVSYEQYPFQKALESIKNKDGIDMILALKPTKQRKKDILFTDTYLSPPWVIFSRDDVGFIGNIDDLAGKTVVVQNGVVIHKLLEKNYPHIQLKVIKHSNSTEIALKTLASAQADAFIGNLAVGSYIIQKNHLTNVKVAAPSPFGNHDNAMAVRDDWEPLLSILNKELKQFSAKKRGEIRDKYLSIKYEHGLKQSDIVGWILGISLLFLFIFVILYRSHLKLKREKKVSDRLNKKLKMQKDYLLTYKKILESVDAGIAISDVDDNHSIIYVNKAFERVTGYLRGEVVGKNLKLLQRDDIEQTQIKTLQDAIRSKQACQVELRNYKKDGTLFINLLTLTPIFNDSGKLIRYVGIQADITDLKHKEKILEEQSRLASMGEMIGNIAHQWRQPLSVISTGATGLKVKKEYGMLEDEELYNICEKIDENAQYLSQTIDDFRNYIKGDTQQVQFNLKNNIKSFIKLVDSSIKTNSINIILDLEEDCELIGYPNELIQCFINIFNNTKDAFIENSSIENRYVFITQKTIDNRVMIEFKDNGGGIPQSIIKKVFEPYFTTKHKSQGTGLGLYMSYNLITNHMEGTLEVFNETFTFNDLEYKGACFKIALPL